ncbi:MAG TPA: hypothetical protein VFV85_05095 [Conexibacter sp.]|nr:hypothetical protein [Conexibacter sp.]
MSSKTKDRDLTKWLALIGFVFGVLVIVPATLAWPLLVTYGFTALMFAAFFAARSAELRDRGR